MKFNQEFYNQIKGTAMGTIFAPTYITLSMGYFEIKLNSVCTFKYGELNISRKTGTVFWMTAVQF